MSASKQTIIIKNYQHRNQYVLAISAINSRLLSASAKLALIRLAYHVNFKTGQCDPGSNTLAAELGRDERHLRRALCDLENAGWLTIERTPGYHRNQYTLTVPEAVAPTFWDKPDPGAAARVRCEYPGENTRAKTASDPGVCAHQTLRTPSEEELRSSSSSGREREERPAAVVSPLPGAGAFEGAAPGAEQAGAPSPEDPPPPPHSKPDGVKEGYATLRRVYARPWADDDAEALKLYTIARAEVGPAVILNAATAWVAGVDSPRFLQPLAKWLRGRCWEKPAPQKPPQTARRRSHTSSAPRRASNELALALLAAGERRSRL